MRLGQKATTEHLVVYLNSEANSNPPRFGFVVSKAVGNAVQRNLVKRRARAVFGSEIQNFTAGQTVVLRALPGLADLDFTAMSSEIRTALGKLGVTKA